jgi:hypothetical protein
MAELGAVISAERVSQIAEQLEGLERRLKEIAAKHRVEIKSDPLVRARFRQLADSLGVDFISSKKNVFGSSLGFGGYYFELATKVVEVCRQEKKYCGGLIPWANVMRGLRRTTVGATNNVTDNDVFLALDKLRVLGRGYDVVTAGSESYIQTAPGGAHAEDGLKLIAVAASMKTTPESGAAATPPPWCSFTHERTPLCPTFTLDEAQRATQWPAIRVRAALQRLLLDGTVWCEVPPRTGGEASDREIYWFISLL